MADIGHCNYGEFRFVSKCPLFKEKKYDRHGEQWVMSEFQLRFWVIRRLLVMIWLVFVGYLVFYETRRSSEFWSVELTTKERLDIIRTVWLSAPK